MIGSAARRSIGVRGIRGRDGDLTFLMLDARRGGELGITPSVLSKLPKSKWASMPAAMS